MCNHAIRCKLTGDCCVQFVDTLEANILADLKTVANATILKVSQGSNTTIVDTCVAFVGADEHAAAAGQAAFATFMMYASPQRVGIFYGTTFGTVAVSNVHQANSSSCTSELWFQYML